MDPTFDTASPEEFTDQAQAGLDARLLVKFYLKPRQDRQASITAGRPVFRDCEYIDIRSPGSHDSVARPATAQDKARFPRHYAAFKQRVEMPQEGTPLSEWPKVSRSMVEQLAYLSIKTVEDLANVPDSSITSIPGLAGLKQHAKNWLELAESDAPMERLNAELAERDAQIAAQAHTISQLSDRLAALEAAAAPTPPAVSPTSLDAAPETPPAPAVAELPPAPESEVVSRRRARRRTNTEVADGP